MGWATAALFERDLVAEASGVFFGWAFSGSPEGSRSLSSARAPARARAPPPPLALLDRLPQRGHQVDNFALLLRLGLRQLLPLGLLADDVEQLFAVLVVVLVGLEGRAQALDEL